MEQRTLIGSQTKGQRRKHDRRKEEEIIQKEYTKVISCFQKSQNRFFVNISLNICFRSFVLIWLIALVNSTVESNMFSTRKKKQQNKRLLIQLMETGADFMIGQSNHEIQTESKTNVADRHTSLNDTNDPTQVNSPQVDMRTLEKNIVTKIRSNVDSVMTTVETRAQNAELTVIENLILPRVELAMKSVNASSGHRVGGAVLDPDRRDFSREHRRP